MSNLLLHCGSVPITKGELAVIQTPAPTQTWTPIPHIDLLNAVENEMLDANLIIENEMLAVSQSQSGQHGDRFFGLLEVKSENENYALQIGLRNSHDRTITCGLCVGSKVFVCDNLAFSVEVVISRKHTCLIKRDLPRLINQAVGKLGDLQEHQAKRIEAYQNTDISDSQFNDLLIRSLDSKVICASKIQKILDESRNPKHDAFVPRTVWSTFNAFTEILKSYDIQDLPKRTQSLHGLCDSLSRLN